MVDIHTEDVQGLVEQGIVHRFWMVPPDNGWFIKGHDHYVMYPTQSCEWNDERIHLVVSHSHKKSYFYGMSFGNRLPLSSSDVEMNNKDAFTLIKKVLANYHVEQTA